MSDFEYTDRYGDRIEVYGDTMPLIAVEGVESDRLAAHLPTDPAQRLAMAEDIVGGPLIEVGDLPEVEGLERTDDVWIAKVEDDQLWPPSAHMARRYARRWLAMARAIEDREKADAEAEAADVIAHEVKVDRVREALREQVSHALREQVVSAERLDAAARAALAALDADQ